MAPGLERRPLATLAPDLEARGRTGGVDGRERLEEQVEALHPVQPAERDHVLVAPMADVRTGGVGPGGRQGPSGREGPGHGIGRAGLQDRVRDDGHPRPAAGRQRRASRGGLDDDPARPPVREPAQDAPRPTRAQPGVRPLGHHDRPRAAGGREQREHVRPVHERQDRVRAGRPDRAPETDQAAEVPGDGRHRRPGDGEQVEPPHDDPRIGPVEVDLGRTGEGQDRHRPAHRDPPVGQGGQHPLGTPHGQRGDHARHPWSRTGRVGTRVAHARAAYHSTVWRIPSSNGTMTR